MRLVLLAAVFALLSGCACATVRSENDVVTVHLVAHSHCDPGWLKTYEEYYRTEVRTILTNVVQALSRDATKRFVWSETSFFSLWWQEQDQSTRDLVRSLARSGQLEFVGGGWVMHDEATVTLGEALAQLTEGHLWLRRHVGAAPRVAWQIDPFGSSSLTPYLFSLAGFDALVIDRIDERLKYSIKSMPEAGIMQRNKSFEFVWRGIPGVSTEHDMLTHVLDSTYVSPAGFDFEGDPKDNPPITDANVADRAKVLVDICRERASWYRTSHVLVPFGQDFRFQDAALEFDNMDRLVSYINARERDFGMRIRYATLSEYFDTMRAAKPELPIRKPENGDFFPYASCWGTDLAETESCIAYWSGFYSSRPEFKQLVRSSGVYLRSIEQITARFANNPVARMDIAPLRRALAICAHHDAITGTEKKAVLENYEEMVHNALRAAAESVQHAVARSVAAAKVEIGGSASGQRRTRIRSASLPQSLLVYNAAAKDRCFLVRFCTDSPEINAASGSPSVSGNALPVLQVWPGGLHEPDCAYAGAVRVCAPGTSYGVVALVRDPQQRAFVRPSPATDREIALSDAVALSRSRSGLYAASVVNGERVTSVPSFARYASYGDGDYILRTTGAAVPLTADHAPGADTAQKSATLLGEQRAAKALPEEVATQGVAAGASAPMIAPEVVRGPLVTELRQQVSSGVSVALSVCYDPSAVECRAGVLRIAFAAHAEENEEIALVAATGWPTGGRFDTDDGIVDIARQFTVRLNDTVAGMPHPRGNIIGGNYYPVLHKIQIDDDTRDRRLALVVPQSFGGSSQQGGECELLVQRRTSHDDGRGVEEPLNDNTTLFSHVHAIIGARGATQQTAEDLIELNEADAPVFLARISDEDRLDHMRQQAQDVTHQADHVEGKAREQALADADDAAASAGHANVGTQGKRIAPGLEDIGRLLPADAIPPALQLLSWERRRELRGAVLVRVVNRQRGAVAFRPRVLARAVGPRAVVHRVSATALHELGEAPEQLRVPPHGIATFIIHETAALADASVPLSDAARKPSLSAMGRVAHVDPVVAGTVAGILAAGVMVAAALRWKRRARHERGASSAQYEPVRTAPDV